MKRIAVLIPCYNEALTIANVIEDFRRHLPGASIYVYDNNSRDETAKIALEHNAIVRYEPRQGKGNVIRSMFRDIEADCYIMVDGDDTYPAQFAPAFVDAILSGRADMVVGDRLSSTYFSENKRPFHNSGNVLIRNLINWLYRSSLQDILTGARAFSRDFVKTYPILSKGFEIETEMTIFALDHNLKILEIPVDYRDRPEGSVSTLHTFRDGFRVISTISRLFCDTKPMAFFSIVALIVLAVFLAFFIPILIQYFHTGLVAKFPTLILISSLIIVSFLLFGCGLLLSVLKRQHSQDFEQRMTIIRMLSAQTERASHERRLWPHASPCCNSVCPRRVVLERAIPAGAFMTGRVMN